MDHEMYTKTRMGNTCLLQLQGVKVMSLPTKRASQSHLPTLGRFQDRPHNHPEKIVGLDDATKAEIRNRFELGIAKPNGILKSLEENNLEIPRKQKLVNFLKKAQGCKRYNKKYKQIYNHNFIFFPSANSLTACVMVSYLLKLWSSRGSRVFKISGSYL